MQKIDVIYPYCESTSYWKMELKYSIRSLCKFFDPLGSIFIIGEKLPDWSTGLRLIPERGWVGGAAERNRLITEKILKVCHIDEISDPFLYMCDDFYLLRKTGLSDTSKNYALSDVSYREVPKKLKKGWWSVFWRTVRVLKEHTETIYNYETHTPKLVNKKFFIDTMFKFGTSHGYNWETLYYNLWFGGQRPVMHDGWVVGISEKLTRMEILGIIMEPKVQFLNHNDAGLNDELIITIRELFPLKSGFEK